MMKREGYPFTPDKTVKVKNWTIEFFIREGKALCYRSGSNVVYGVTEKTDDIVHLPNYVLKELERLIFLKEWRVKKIKQSVSRLNEISKKIEKTLERI